MVSTISPAEERRIRDFREAQVLQKVERHRLTHVKRTVLITCPDGNQFNDLYNRHRHICLCGDEQDAEQVHHPLALNGGALLLPHSSPILLQGDGTYAPDGEVLLRNLNVAIELKDPQAIILYAHMPCGMAHKYDLSVDEQVHLLIAGKKRARRAAETLGVKDMRAWLHICYPDGRQRTYHVCRSKYEEFFSD